MGKVLIYFKKTYAYIFEIMIMDEKKDEAEKLLHLHRLCIIQHFFQGKNSFTCRQFVDFDDMLIIF